MAQKKKKTFVYIIRQILRNTKKNKNGGNEPEIADPSYRKLLEESPDKKVPFASKTKGYYRFTSEYPSAADAEGYRVNGMQQKKPLSTAAITFLIVGIVLCFCLGYTGIHMALSVSDLPPETTVETTTAVIQETTQSELIADPEEIPAGDDAIG